MGHLLNSRMIQPKLTVGPADDEYEREAERVADSVMRMPDVTVTARSRIQRMCSDCEEELHHKDPTVAQLKPSASQISRSRGPNEIQRSCSACEKEVYSPVNGLDEKGNILVQVKTAPSQVQTSPLDSSALDSIPGGGQPLAESARTFFERRMRHDFSNVRVHADARADASARSIDARAYTHSDHVVFRAGEYAPDTSRGQHLLAHELTHVIQQGASSSIHSDPSGNLTTLDKSIAARRCPGSIVQRACEVTKPPADLVCPEAVTSAGTGTNISFGQDSFVLSAADRSTLAAIAAAWHTGGGVAVLRIDGFASCDGPAERNWRLSCNRAQAVATELEAPSDGSPGIPNTHLEMFANGETDQFSRTAIPPNRRVVITGGGAPPPGPRCALTVTGPDEVDHYCAAYVPSDAATCPTFPAPNITLTVAGAAAGATLRWSIVRGASRASIIGANSGASVLIKGDSASGAQGDVTVQVTDGTCTTAHFLTVREPSSMPGAQAASTGPTFVRILVTYSVLDQFGNPMGPNICWDETVTTCANSHGTPFAFGDVPTNASGQVTDQLQVTFPGGLPASLCIKLNQVITVGGCGPLAQNTILFRAGGATLNQRSSCVAGDPCP
jgi:outer membrane protein OmpA-like peptidoglycan-associated protein